jgi:hypothetical protein
VLLVQETLDQFVENAAKSTTRPAPRGAARRTWLDNPPTPTTCAPDQFASTTHPSARLTLVGKKEILVPYNSYKLTEHRQVRRHPQKESHPDLARYEHIASGGGFEAEGFTKPPLQPRV